MNKMAIRQAFERAAPAYDAAAFLQQEVARRLDERLELMKIQPSLVVDAGCGTGYALPGLHRRYPDARLLGLDLAHAMTRLARDRLPKPTALARMTRRLTGGGVGHGVVCADLERLPITQDSTDLVWSSLTLQWVADLEATFRQVRGMLRPGGLFIFSTFGPDTLKELRTAFQGLDGHDHVNRFADMHDIGDQLVYAGFQHPVMEMECLTLTYAHLKDLLHELKAIGAHTVLGPRRTGLMGREAWARLERNYEALRHEGRLPATYEIVYGHAWVGPKDRMADGRKVIQLKMERRKAGLES